MQKFKDFSLTLNTYLHSVFDVDVMDDLVVASDVSVDPKQMKTHGVKLIC